MQDCIALLIDLSKALDTVGFDERREIGSQWQNTSCCGYQSNFMIVNKGVPQGSILGPLVFTIFRNELGEKVRNSTIHLYADHTILNKTAPSVAHAVQNLHFDFCSVQQTLIYLKLLLKLDKNKMNVLQKTE